jgi:hypothetical protein
MAKQKRETSIKNIFNDLTGGQYSKPAKADLQPAAGTFAVYMQFGDDEPQCLQPGIGANNSYNITMYHGDQYLVFTDNVTGKTFKLFTK